MSKSPDESNEKTDCHGKKVPVWVIKEGQKMNFDRPAYIDDDHCVTLKQLRRDECVIAPAAIYRNAS
jgi:hypothetical protein